MIRAAALARSMRRTHPQAARKLSDYLVTALGEVPSQEETVSLKNYYNQRAKIEYISGDVVGALESYRHLTSLMEKVPPPVMAKIKALQNRVGGDQ
jgi:lipase chaperone LimK